MRYADSPRVDIMPQIPDSNDFGKTAANKRLQPKSSEMKENFEHIAEQLGGQLVEFRAPNAARLEKQVRVDRITPFTRKPPTITPIRVTTAAQKAAQEAGERAAQSAARRTTAKLTSRLVPGLGAAAAAVEAGQRLAKGDVVGAVLSGASGVPGPVGWGALGLDVIRTALTPAEVEKVKPQKPPAPKPTTAPPMPKPQPQPEVQAQPDVSKTTPVGSKVKIPSATTDARAKSQTQPETQKDNRTKSTRITTTTTDNEDKKRRRGDLNIPEFKPPKGTSGRFYYAQSL